MIDLIKAKEESFYPTPEWAAQAILNKETFDGLVWEPSCGDGAISKVCLDAGYDVLSTDLNDFGFGTSGCDFLEMGLERDNIMTNPPFHLDDEFVQQALKLARKKVVLLLRLAFLEGQKRKTDLYDVRPPSRVWVSSRRITMYPGGVRTGGSSNTAYAWYVWDQEESGETKLGWL